ncbi:hypothetical protein [Marinomonas gallaica]|uniref:hypothetical protein n=1 Tax=Marinomonas gallaica TaxID=1806667 RepID=UPI003A936ADC
MKTLSIRKFALITLATQLSACSDHDFQALEEQLPSIEKFAPLAELVEHHGSGATIDPCSHRASHLSRASL